MKLTPAQLHALQTRRITKRALAQRLRVSESYLSRCTPKLPKGPVRALREAASSLSQARRSHRLKLAKQVAAGRLKLHTAAAKAKCSERTIRRYLARLVPPPPK